MEKFRKTIQTGTHVLYFGAEWCKNCVPIKKELEQMEDSVCYYDVDKHEDELAVCGITKLPTIQVWKGGKNVAKYEGADQCNVAVIIRKHCTNVENDSIACIEEF